MTYSTAALVGATGGAGTTRLAVELGATLARDGREVAILDAAFATEGLARHLSGRVEPDVTTLLTDDPEENERPPTEKHKRPLTEDQPLLDDLHEHPATADLDGRLALCPAHAPFERLARAKTPDAAQRFETFVSEVGREFDHAIVDAPPVAANQAVAAVSAVERVAAVAPASERGVDAVQRTRGRVADVGASVDAVIANRVAPDQIADDLDPDPDADSEDADAEENHPLRSADAAVPESEVAGVDGVPASAPDPEPDFAPAVAHVAEVVFGAELELEFEESGLLDLGGDVLPDALS